MLSLNKFIVSNHEYFSKQALQHATLMQGTKRTFFTAQNATLCSLQKTVHFMLPLNLFSSLPPSECDKKDKANLVTAATC